MELCQTYASSGVDIVYTGHMHANDISQYTFEGNTFYDIETGSLLTYPSPIRITRIRE